MWFKVKKLISTALVIILLILPVTAFAQTLNLNPEQPADPNLKNKIESGIIAEVNGQKITKKELAREANINRILTKVNKIDQQFVQALTRTESGKKVIEEYQKKQLDNLINNILLQQKAKKLGISLSQTEKEKLYQKRKKSILKNNDLSQKEYLSILNKQGFANEKEYKQQFFKNPQLKVNKLIENKVISNIEVSESEIKKVYEENKDQFTKNGQSQNLEKVKSQIKEMLKQQKRNKQIKEYVEQLRTKAEITKNI